MVMPSSACNSLNSYNYPPQHKLNINMSGPYTMQAEPTETGGDLIMFFRGLLRVTKLKVPEPSFKPFLFCKLSFPALQLAQSNSLL